MDWGNLVSGIIGGFIGWLGGFIHEWLTRPHLVVEYSNHRLGFKMTEWDCVMATDSGNKITYSKCCVRISVRNKRKRTAQRCRGFLVSVDCERDGRWEPTAHWDGQPLEWSRRTDDEARTGIDIPHNVIQYLNVFSLSSRPHSGFTPCTVPSTPNTFVLLDPGKARFTVQVSGENIPTQLFAIVAHWEGDWRRVWRDHGNPSINVYHLNHPDA